MAHIVGHTHSAGELSGVHEQTCYVRTGTNVNASKTGRNKYPIDTARIPTIGWLHLTLVRLSQHVYQLKRKDEANEIVPEKGAGKVLGLEGGSVLCPRLHGAPSEG